jgi:hypothetical protein
MLDRLRPLLHDSTRMATDDTAAKPISLYDRDKRRGTKDQVRQQTSRAQRYARYAQVKQLQAKGRAIIQIARELHISRQTVRKYMASESFPELARSAHQRSILDPYVAYLQERWDAGEHDNRQLLQALRERGYRGSVRPIVQWICCVARCCQTTAHSQAGAQRARLRCLCRQGSLRIASLRSRHCQPRAGWFGCCCIPTTGLTPMRRGCAPSCGRCQK